MFRGTKKTVLIWQKNKTLQSELSLETVSGVIRWIFYNHSGIIKKDMPPAQTAHVPWTGMAGRPRFSADGGQVLKGVPRPPASTPAAVRVSQTNYTHTVGQQALQSNVRLRLRCNDSSAHWPVQDHVGGISCVCCLAGSIRLKATLSEDIRTRASVSTLYSRERAEQYGNDNIYVYIYIQRRVVKMVYRSK